MPYRTEIGIAVRDRLAGVPGAVKVPVSGLDLFVLTDFLSGPECQGLMTLIDRGRQPSTLFEPDIDPEFRTSESCDLDRADPLVRAIETRIARLTCIDPAHGETVQGQRYAVGQQFKPHHDFFHTDQAYWAGQERTGGQRTWTVMMFLNAPAGGGATFFPSAGVKVDPIPGNLLAWNNLDGAGEPNPTTIHQGMPVTDGAKYIITKWYRERSWG